MTTKDLYREKLLRLLEAAIAESTEPAVAMFPGFPSYHHCPETVLNALAEIPEIAQTRSMLFNRGMSHHMIDTHQYGQAIIARALTKGPSQAIDDLYAFLSPCASDCIEVCLLGGIEVTETTELLPGVFIAPPADVPESNLGELVATAQSDEDAFMFNMRAPANLREAPRIPKAALYRFASPRPRFSPSTDNVKPLSPEEVEELTFLQRVATLLTIVGPSSPIVWRAYTELVDESLLKGHIGHAWSSAIEETRVSSTTVVTRDDLLAKRPTFEAYFTLPQERRAELDVPLHRLNEAIRHRSPVNRAIDLGIALEALFLSGKTDPAQLGFQLRMRGAWLLGRTLEERREIVSQLKSIYQFRSNAVHTGVVANPKKPSDFKKVIDMLDLGIALCADAIQAVILAKDFNWDDLVLGARDSASSDSN